MSREKKLRQYSLTLYTHDLDIGVEDVKKVLATPTLRQVLFPASTPIAPGKSRTIPTPEDFSLDLIAPPFRDAEGIILIPLYSPTKIKFEVTLERKPDDIRQFGHTFVLDFTEEHLARGEVDAFILKRLIEEIAPLIHADSIRVFHHYSEPEHLPDGSITSKRPRVYHGVLLEPEWFTYYNAEHLSRVGRERFRQVQSAVEVYDFLDGIMVILQHEPMDKTNPKHIARRKQVERELGFDQLPDDPIPPERRWNSKL